MRPIALGPDCGASQNRRSDQRRNMVWPHCSAGFQPAVSPTSSRQTSLRLRPASAFKRWRVGNPRYSRLEACATMAVSRRARSGWGVLLGFGLVLAWLLAAPAQDADHGTQALTKPAYPDDSPTNGLGSWIWAATTSDRQTCQFWKTFEVPANNPVKHARIMMTVDNEFTLYLDGREVGRGAEWRELFEYDVSLLMSPGTHVLAVNAYNSSSSAGMVFGLRVDFTNGPVEIKSDESWRIVPEGTKGWERRTRAPKTWPEATIIAPLGSEPWQEMPVRVNSMPTLEPIKVFFWQTGWFQVSLVSLFGLVLVISLRLLAQVALHRKEQWLLQQERMRIARDIHDDLGSRMTQLVLHGEVAQSELPSESETRSQIDRICEEARGILSTLDEILWALNPKRDAFRDFTSFICGYAQVFFKPTRIQCLFDVDPSVSPVMLTLPQKRALLMVIKETLNNIVKHSEATEVIIQVKWQAQKVLVVVSDNGKGFDQASLDPGRNGLVNMSQRMSELGGACIMTSQPGKGCRTEFSIPLRRARRTGWGWIRKMRPALDADEPSHQNKREPNFVSQ
ncbi:MAG: hypothetical protein C5B50_26425 [Verrucomicrobia bacterium]|nr:MAG: hypothetical protein C5B50_26425 [Verrucomicrobiota bacterium]